MKRAFPYGEVWGETRAAPPSGEGGGHAEGISDIGYQIPEKGREIDMVRVEQVNWDLS